ncbi:hypothetical protein KZ483_05530 [Paenibacillus sp. sptzw28]|nr:hypothetical protein KZ483_05530 [Paenibacillus sp. sptzw28]
MMVHALSAIEPIGSLVGDGSGKGDPDARLFVFENCEYRRHFLAYQPDIAVITNIDFDHPDYFADVDDVAHACLWELEIFRSIRICCSKQNRPVRFSYNFISLLDKWSLGLFLFV